MLTNQSNELALASPRMRVANRYEIISELGRGGFGTTYKALDCATNELVAVKQLRLWGENGWKALELFQREAAVLARLRHPNIPAYVDHFEIETDGDVQFYIVQQLAEGQSFAAAIKAGWTPTERELRRLAEMLLDVLAYLHTATPPVIHRDIKPENIILRPDGQVSLVDFGAVRDACRTLSPGSTIAGTLGYMAPEQLHGHAVPASDLYGLGNTLVHLLTGKDPEDLPRHRNRIVLRKVVRSSQRFAEWLDRLVAPAMEDRFQTARAALRALRVLRLPLPGFATRVTVLLVGGGLLIYFAGPIVRSWNTHYVATESPYPSLTQKDRVLVETSRMAMSLAAKGRISLRPVRVDALGRLAAGAESPLPNTVHPIPNDFSLVAGKTYPRRVEEWYSDGWDRIGHLPDGDLDAQYQWVRVADDRGEVRARADFDGDGKLEVDISISVECRATDHVWDCTTPALHDRLTDTWRKASTPPGSSGSGQGEQ